MQSNQNKNLVLIPSLQYPTEFPLLLSDGNSVVPNARKFCTCSNVGYSRHFHAADAPNRSCPSCGMRMMNSGITFVYPAVGISAAAAVAEPERGFVKEAVPCMVMDSLEVWPMSAISSITFFNKFN